MSARRRPLAANDPRHGTYNGYHNLGCHCRPCTEAHSAYILARNHRTGRTVPLEDHLYIKRLRAELRDNHGTETRYTSLRCRCEHCRAAAADARRLRRLNEPPEQRERRLRREREQKRRARAKQAAA